jgi:hypothetical protein
MGATGLGNKGAGEVVVGGAGRWGGTPPAGRGTRGRGIADS